MLEMLTDIDRWLFLLLNAGVANDFCDWLMPIATEIKYLLWLIVPALLLLVIFGGGKGRRVVLLALVLVAVTDQVNSHWLKPIIARPRPCHTVEEARVLYRCGKTFSFPSSHAVNAMGAALFFGCFYRRRWWLLFAVAFLNSYSRVYLGVHYPFDMLAGWILGGGLAYGMIWFDRTYAVRFLGRWRFFRDDRLRTVEIAK